VVNSKKDEDGDVDMLDDATSSATLAEDAGDTEMADDQE